MESHDNGHIEPASYTTAKGRRHLPSGLFIPCVALLVAACSSVTLPYDPAAMELDSRRTVVLVPGMTGVELLDRQSGKRVWGGGANLIGPHDGGYRIALPISRQGEAALEPGRAIDRIRLGPITKPIYGPIAKLFENHGWRRGELATPTATDDLFFYAYDWRRDNVDSARRLAVQLETAARTRGDGRLAVTLICQSNGGHICRYLVKYGSASLEEAERGLARPPLGVTIDQVILVGNANGGSLRILRYLNRGRKYVRYIGRKLHPETFFTLESLYQDLPAYRTDLFVDELGEPLQVDLYSSETWRRYGWSIYSESSARRLAADRRPDLFGDDAARAQYLDAVLERARRIQELMRREGDLGQTRYYMIQSQAIATPERAVLRRDRGRWETLITGDKALHDLSVARELSGPGDGHATHGSQLWLASDEMEAMGDEPLAVDAPHFEMIRHPDTLQYMLSLIARPATVRAQQVAGAPGSVDPRPRPGAACRLHLVACPLP